MILFLNTFLVLRYCIVKSVQCNRIKKLIDEVIRKRANALSCESIRKFGINV